jgi:hypothetical protein
MQSRDRLCVEPASLSAYHNTDYALQDFEGQRLAEMITTVLLGAVGVRFTSP